KAPADPNHRTRPELAMELIRMLAGWFPGRKLVLVGDSLHGGRSVLRKLPDNVDMISHAHPKGALYEKAQPKTAGQLGRPRKVGKRLPGMVSALTQFDGAVCGLGTCMKQDRQFSERSGESYASVCMGNERPVRPLVGVCLCRDRNRYRNRCRDRNRHLLLR
ncbi:MAG: transposase, partial [bacterium]|nr:transposase [bacterium]